MAEKKVEDLTSALWRVMLKGKYKKADQLIVSGAEVNEPRNTSMDSVTTLLHYATQKKDVDLMCFLIKHGANCNALDSKNSTPLHWAVSVFDSPHVVDVLINAGAIVDALNIKHQTPFLLAVIHGLHESAEKLIARGASIQEVDAKGLSALSLAVKLKDQRMMRILISHNINVDAEDPLGKTALHLAVENDEDDIARILLDNGADPNKKQTEGQTCLHLAAYRHCLSSVRLLLERGARVNEINNAGNTALHGACMRGHDNTVALLVNFGADINAHNHNGKTAFQMLRRNRPLSEVIAKMVIREAVKLEELGKPLCEEYRQIAQSYEKYSTFYQECREEVERMRSERIDVGDSAVSFFNIFSMDDDKVAVLTRNEMIVEAFETSDCLSMLKIYDVDLIMKLKRAKRCAKFRMDTEDCLDDVLGETLPAPILQKIAAYVEYDDHIIENKLE